MLFWELQYFDCKLLQKRQIAGPDLRECCDFHHVPK
jgi:hypothetical protein